MGIIHAEAFMFGLLNFFFYQFAQMCGRRRRGRDVKAYETLESHNIQNMESGYLINSDNSILS